MTQQVERYIFIQALKAEGVPETIGRAILRDAKTLHRLAEAECNGDWPSDNGDRPTKPCQLCETLVAPVVLTAAGLCPACRAQARITTRLAPYSVRPIFSGDPRGAVVKLQVPSGRTDDWVGTGLCVP